MSLHVLLLLIFVNFLFLPPTRADENNCTARDDRNIYSSCMLDYRTMALWCDSTNFTTLPDPDLIHSFAQCSRAVALFMNSSCLTALNKETFHKYTALREANFAGNLIKNVGSETFSAAPYLRQLDLSQNKLEEIEDDSFSDVSRLQMLNLSSNQLVHLNDGVFEKMVSLQTILIDDNHLRTISIKWFPQRTKIQMLSVRNNQLRQGMESELEQFTELKYFHLDGNNIQSLHRRNFKNLQNLEVITISGNELEQIEPDTFMDTMHLVTIDLRNNELESLPRQLFNNTCELTKLLLSGNQLSIIHPDWFINKLRLSTYSLPLLRNNPWSCDCKMINFWNFSRNYRFSLHLRCRSPAKFRGLMMTQLSEAQLMESGNCSVEEMNSKKYLEMATLLTTDCMLKELEQNVIYSEDGSSTESSGEGKTPFQATVIMIGIACAFIFLALTLLFYSRKQRETKSKKITTTALTASLL